MTAKQASTGDQAAGTSTRSTGQVDTPSSAVAGLPAQHADDRALARAVLAKDRAAFDRFFASYFARLYRFCVGRTGNPTASEDIVQETLIKALSHLDSYRGEASLLTWLCQICRHEISNWARREGRNPAAQTSDDDYLRAVLESLDNNELAPDEAEELESLVHLTLDHLPDQYSSVLEWKYIEGLTVEEIANRMQTTLTAVQSMLARARRAFKTRFVDVQQEFAS